MHHSSYSRRLLVAAVGCFCSVIAFASVLPDTLLAFPGAEGFGKYTSGGRGGKVVYVTTLADDANGETVGSLRWAMKQYPNEPLTVCFAVTGEIRLVKDLRINRKNYTIAGQTAPGMGIVITHNKVNCGGSENFIIRNIRFRIGRNDVNGNIITQNAFGAENCSNYIIDHCEFGWSTEENMNTYDSHFITVQYCIVHEGLNNSGHPKGARGYGCQWGGSPATYHHNLLVNNNKRSCRFNGAQSNDFVVYLDYINNVVYNFEGGSNGCYGGENTAKLAEGEYNGLNSAHECNFINNYYKVGPNTTNKKYFVSVEKARSGATSWGPSQWYLSGNVFDGAPSATEDNWSAVVGKAPYDNTDTLRVDTIIRPATPWWRWTTDSIYGRYDFDMYAYAAEAFQTAEQAFETVLDTAGCFPRDHIGLRLTGDTRNGTFTYKGSKTSKKGIIDTEDDAEGFYDYPDTTAMTDSDLDGMPDEWEIANNCNPQVADNNVRHSSGYTMLELYLHYAMTHRPQMNDDYPNKYTISTTPNNQAWGITAGDTTVRYLDSVIISATANYGYHFESWNDGDTTNPRKVIVTEDIIYQANFAKNTYRISTYAANGSVSCTSTAEYFDEVTLNAIPNYGYHFVQWSDSIIDNPRTFVITQDTIFTAEFAYNRSGTCGNDYILTWEYNPYNYTLTISGEGAFDEHMECGVEAHAKLKELIFAEGVTSVGQAAFRDNTTLQKVTFSSTITKIHEYAFYNCDNLLTIINYKETPTNVYSNTFDGVDKDSCILYVHEGSIERYRNAAVWRDFYHTESIEDIQGIDNIRSDEKGKLIHRNGHVFIQVGEKVYTLQGQLVP